MRAYRFVLPIAAFLLVGCDRITGEGQRKVLDAEAIGYACRVSFKPPEDCMQENDTHSPTAILYGWKQADKEIRGKVIDPTMGKNPPSSQDIGSVPNAAADKPAVETASNNTEAQQSGQTADAGKPGQGAAGTPAGR